MLHLAWQGVRHNRGRYLATVVAIVTGVAFYASTGFIGDGIIHSLEGDVDRQYGAVDAAVVPDDTGGTADEFADTLRLPQASYDTLVGNDAVEAGAGIVTGPVGFLAADGTTFGTDATGRLWIEDDELNPLDLVEGAAPSGAGDVTVDKGLAEDESLDLGDDVALLTQAGRFDATIVGITEFGSADSLDPGGTVTLPEATVFEWLTLDRPEYQAVYLRGSGSQDDLVASIEADVPPGFRAQTGDDFRADQASEVVGFAKVLKQGLQFFATLALLVGAFVIYNTFSVIVAQRQRELAVLAAVGATPKQLKRSLRYEGLVIGFAGAVLGVVVGFALALLLDVVLSAFGVSLPGGGVRIAPLTVVSSVLVGTIITVVSVMVPARRAARTEPIEALRDAAAETGGVSRRRVTAVVVLAAVGLLGLLAGQNAVAVGVGALAVFVAVILAGPLIALVGSRVLRPVASVLGLEGRLALDNSARNPKRTATTANALLIGVFLVSFVTVAGSSLKDFALSEIHKLESADYYASSDGGTIDDALVADLEDIDEVNEVVPFRLEPVTADGEPSRISTGDLGRLREVANLQIEDGSLDDLGDGTIAVVPTGGGEAPPVGSTVSIGDPADGRSTDLEVVAVLKQSIDTGLVGNLVDVQTFDGIVGQTAPTVAFIDVASGAQSDVEDAIDDRIATRPDITLTAGNAIGEIVRSAFDFLINAVTGLLLMSVLVAMIGIVNTLSLSIIERRRELGLLRVVGMVDRRVQHMVQLESVLISVLGTLSGIVLGTFVGLSAILAIDRLAEASIGLRVPWIVLGVILALGVVLGFAAAYIPSRRSTRLDVLDAIQAT